jgi:hypothetical protein
MEKRGVQYKDGGREGVRNVDKYNMKKERNKTKEDGRTEDRMFSHIHL